MLAAKWSIMAFSRTTAMTCGLARREYLSTTWKITIARPAPRATLAAARGVRLVTSSSNVKQHQYSDADASCARGEMDGGRLRVRAQCTSALSMRLRLETEVTFVTKDHRQFTCSGRSVSRSTCTDLDATDADRRVIWAPTPGNITSAAGLRP